MGLQDEQIKKYKDWFDIQLRDLNKRLERIDKIKKAFKTKGKIKSSDLDIDEVSLSIKVNLENGENLLDKLP